MLCGRQPFRSFAGKCGRSRLISQKIVTTEARAAHRALASCPIAAKPYAVNFSIITPSFRNSRWLKLCIASVADQQGASFEHIVQDSCSDDGTGDWLPGDRRVR